MSAKPFDDNRGKQRKNSRFSAVKVAAGGVALSVALILSYIEAIFPLNIGVPGIKLGLANLAIMFILYKYGLSYAAILSLLRVLTAGILFGNITSFLYSLAGAALSLGVMWLLKKTGIFSSIGVSVAGGICHNLAQICVAAIILETEKLLYYLPALVIGGVISGAVIGVIGGLLIKKIKI